MNSNSAKLTKKRLMGLPDGLFLVRKRMITPTKSLFAETIRPGPHRLDQWQRIVAVGANVRLCHIFPSPAAGHVLIGIIPDSSRN
jgi:hypothetical protein